MKRTIVTLATFAALVLPSSAGAALGDNFGFAPATDVDTGTTAPAFTDGFAVPPGPGGTAAWAGVCDLDDGLAAVGTLPAAPFPGCIAHSSRTVPPFSPGIVPVPSGISDGWLLHDGRGDNGAPGAGPGWRLADVTGAGTRADGSAGFWFARSPLPTSGHPVGAPWGSDGAPRNITVGLPPGVLANPNALPKCQSEDLDSVPTTCSPRTQVGVATITEGVGTYVSPVYNVESRKGKVAELMISGAGSSVGLATNQPIVARVRTETDFGADGGVRQIPSGSSVISSTVTLWAVPWARSHDRYRPVSRYCGTGAFFGMPLTGLAGGFGSGCSQQPQGYDPSWGPIEPFFTTQTECSAVNPVTRIFADNYHTDVTAEAESVAPLVTGCEDLSFPAAISLDPTTIAADSPSGLDVELTIPQNETAPPEVRFDNDDDNGAPAYWKSRTGLAVSHLKDTVVTLPEGFSINPSAANGQGVCTSAQIGLTSPIGQTPITFNDDDPSDGRGQDCPQAAKIATVSVETPLLDPEDWPTGEVYLAAQSDNPFGSNYAIYIVVRSVERGLVVKLAGEVEADPLTGRLKTTVADNPQLTFDRFELHFKGGSQAPLATSPVCGTFQNQTTLAPYSAPNTPVAIEEDVVISQEPNGTASCPTTLAGRPLNVGFDAGSTQLISGAHSPFTVRLQRPDGNQEFDRVEVTTPEGLVAKLAGVPYCSEESIKQAIDRTAVGDGRLEQQSPSCPEASRVGTTTIGAGAGLSPFYASGKVYLAGPYKGAPVSLAFIVPAVAGPFDLGVQVVRTALNVNPRTAQVTAVSDSIPKILAGVPLRIRDIRVDIDRPDFTLNPTDCSEQVVTGKVFGSHGAVSDVTNHFQVAECARLSFKPKLTFKLRGGTKRGRYPQFTATLNARPGDANIASVSAALPRSEFLANEHIRTICTRPDFAADNCPDAAIYGWATAWSPLLDEPLTGPVYLRSSSNLLPDLVPDLRGPAHQPIKVELAGRTDSIRGGIRNTFDVVPDAPVTRFVLRMQGGNKGLLVNSRDICRRTYRARVEMTAQNGRELTLKPKMQASCGKKSKGKKHGGHKRAR